MDGLALPPLLTPLGIIVATALLWWRVSRVEHEINKLREWKHDEVQQDLQGLKLRMGLVEHTLEHLEQGGHA